MLGRGPAAAPFFPLPAFSCSSSWGQIHAVVCQVRSCGMALDFFHLEQCFFQAQVKAGVGWNHHSRCWVLCTFLIIICALFSLTGRLFSWNAAHWNFYCKTCSVNLTYFIPFLSHLTLIMALKGALPGLGDVLRMDLTKPRPV